MLDENLPTFFIRSNGQKHTSTIFLCQHGNEAEPAYSVRHLDPSEPVSRNRYAVALYDPYIPDVLFGEVLIVPEWTQPSLSAEAIRQNGGVAPPPEPILPSQFTIHLYNPDQDVTVRYKPKSWNSPPTWEFEMPQRSFRQPSNSTLDRTQTDPAASDITPKLKFVWRKDGTLSKDFACYLSGKTTAPDGRKKNKEPDITISIFKGFKEFTLYEPNLYRVEMEDFKGLEVVLMLGAVVIRDVFFGSLKEAFHVSDPPRVVSAPVNANGVATASKPQKPQVTIPQRETRPAVDPRTQWEIDAEYARLKQQQEAEERERKRREQEAERKTRKLLEAEERAARKKQAEIDKETERLKKIYGREEQLYRQQQQSASRLNVTVSSPQSPNHHIRHGHYQRNSAHHSRTHSTVNFQQPELRPQSSLSFFGKPQASSSPAVPQLKEKKSFFGFRKNSDENKLIKKRSSMF
ncbi:hypothetical protein VTN77DRAFT_3676 [Rasamsonia byssochlamydoides]|uniref:uncharacterized protein n=1 Tax=Rasamsonia byssochlamydoides TaxID=89139 RepID=UPI003743F201